MDREKIIETIEQFRTFEENWNGYKATPISEKVIERALIFAKEISPIPRVYPTANNTIQFEWYSNSVYVEIEIGENGIELFQCRDYE